MESPRVPAAMALMRKAGYKFDIMTTSFFLGKRDAQDLRRLRACRSGRTGFMSRCRSKSANATDFFSIPSDRVVELGAQVTI